MATNSGAFVQGAEAYARFLEVFIDGHWWVVGDALENVGKTTKHLGANAYPLPLRRRDNRRPERICS